MRTQERCPSGLASRRRKRLALCKPTRWVPSAINALINAIVADPGSGSASTPSDQGRSQVSDDATGERRCCSVCPGGLVGAARMISTLGNDDFG